MEKESEFQDGSLDASKIEMKGNPILSEDEIGDDNFQEEII